MRKLLFLAAVLTGLVSCVARPSCKNETNSSSSQKQKADTADMTNNFYDNTETFQLKLSDLVIEGEIANPGKVDFSKLHKHSVIVKETVLDSTGSDKFVGAYRYDGFSLFDILDDRILKKANGSEFKPVIDLFVEIENSRGEKVVFSWGEIYYPTNLHRILIASDVSRIVPSKTRDLWPLPSESRIIAGNDLVTERNISSPVRIIVRSNPLSFPVKRNMMPMYEPIIKLFNGKKQTDAISKLPAGLAFTKYNTVFYGRGMGIHSTSPFSGVLLKDLLISYYPFTRENLKTGIFCLSGKDGYRCSFSYSEIFNRNDQQEFLLIRGKDGDDGGLYRIFAACDFFSDRAVKSLSEIHLGY